MRERPEFKFDDLPSDQGILQTDGEDTAVHRTDRDLILYDEAFGLSDEDTRDKTVLNLGSGRSRRFERQLNDNPERRPGKIVSLDPLAERKQDGELVVSGRAEDQPFQNSSFDLILAYLSVPQYLKTKESIAVAFEEAIRVLKPGGRAEFFPLSHTVKGSGRNEQNLKNGTISPDEIVYFPDDDGLFGEVFGEIEEKHPEIAVRLREVWVSDPDQPDKYKREFKLILYKMPEQWEFARPEQGGPESRGE